MKDFIKSCLSLNLGEKTTLPIYEELRVVGEQRENELSIAIESCDKDGNSTEIIQEYKVSNINEDTLKPIMTEIVNFLYQSFLIVIYRVYQVRWCEERSFDVDDVCRAFVKGEQYQGQMFASLEEFENNEFCDREIMSDYLNEDNLKVYDFIMNNV